jgi:hypothetical protein
LLVCRWVLARLRHQRIFSLEELNAAIFPLLADLNKRSFQRLPGSRRGIFEALDRPAIEAMYRTRQARRTPPQRRADQQHLDLSSVLTA